MHENARGRIRVIIVDDEPVALRRLRRLLAGEGDIAVVAECVDGRSAAEAIRTLEPDLVFLDIELPELDGFEVLEEMDVSRRPVVIFVTAYGDHALRAFDVRALDYLLKPYDRERFGQALEQARERLAVRGSDAPERIATALQRLLAKRRPIDRFVVKSDGRIVFLPADRVESIESDGNYLEVHTGQSAFRVRGTLSELESRLDPRRFVRVHRSWIVNIDRIREVQTWFKGQYRVVLASQRIVPVGGAFRSRLEDLVLHLR